MEERNITAIAHKENLLRYVVDQDEKMIGLLKAWHNEIFKYYGENGRLELLIEEKYEGEIRYALEQHEIPILKEEKGIGSVTLVGLGINLDPGFLASTLEICRPFQIKRIQHSDMTIELTLPSIGVKDCVAALHEAFIGRQG